MLLVSLLLEQVFKQTDKAAIVDLFAESPEQDLVIDAVEASLDVPFDEPLRPRTCVADLA